MARQTGPLRYKGTLGEIRHFKIKGLKGDFAGLKGGPSGEQVKTAAEFVRTRENMNEFGGCAIAGKSLRIGLSQLMRQMSDRQLTGRVTSIMKRINLEDQSEARGYRAILISTQKQYLLGLNFNSNMSFDTIFFAPYAVSATPDRTSATLTVDAFNPASFVSAPTGTTHFRLINTVSVLSDFAYNATSGAYEPIDIENNEASTITYSDYLDLATATTAATTVTAELDGTPTLSADVSVINAVGIEFYQKVGTDYYLLNSGNALKINNIF